MNACLLECERACVPVCACLREFTRVSLRTYLRARVCACVSS